MLALSTLQQAFLNEVFRKPSEFTNLIASEDAKDRLQVHRDTIFKGLCHALSVIYPGIWQLLGSECANNAALMFCHTLSNLPTSGCLDHWGKKFPKFLASVSAFASLPYLPDYAWFEYLSHQVYCGYGKSVYFFESIFPIDQIQDLLASPNPQPLDLQRKPSYAILTRSENKVLTLWMNAEKWQSLQLRENAHA